MLEDLSENEGGENDNEPENGGNEWKDRNYLSEENRVLKLRVEYLEGEIEKLKDRIEKMEGTSTNQKTD